MNVRLIKSGYDEFRREKKSDPREDLYNEMCNSIKRAIVYIGYYNGYGLNIDAVRIMDDNTLVVEACAPESSYIAYTIDLELINGDISKLCSAYDFLKGSIKSYEKDLKKYNKRLRNNNKIRKAHELLGTDVPADVTKMLSVLPEKIADIKAKITKAEEKKRRLIYED